MVSKQDGSIIVSGPGDSINLPGSFFYHPGHGLPKPSWVPPNSLLPSQMVAATGLTAHITGNKCVYACFTINRVNYETVSGPAVVLQQVEFKDSKRTGSSVGKKYIPYSRAALDKAAKGAGLTVLFPDWSASHTFSAAYVSGFLRKVDETMRMNR